MAYLHCRTQIRTRITVLCRNFPLVQIQTQIPLLRYNKIGTDIYLWDGHPSLKWVQ